MIKIENNYYSCEDEPNSQDKPRQSELEKQKKQSFEVTGDVKGYLNTVSQEIKKIKQLRMRQKEQSSKNHIILEKLNPKSQEALNEGQAVTLNLMVPEQLYILDQKIAGIEEKVKINELIRQKIQRKGKISERAKILSAQIQKLSQKSPDIIENSIMRYTQGLDEKEQNIKAMFLYEAFTTTQGMTEEMDMLSTYLTNLNQIQNKLKGMASKQSIVENHTVLLEKRATVSKKICQLYAFMKEEYAKLQKEIDSI